VLRRLTTEISEVTEITKIKIGSAEAPPLSGFIVRSDMARRSISFQLQAGFELLASSFWLKENPMRFSLFHAGAPPC
jgi:hypothetical protein